MEKLAKGLFSMRAMAMGLFIFLTAIAIATFIESYETTQAAKLWVYNAKWFELLLAFLSVNLIANIFRYQMWRREKIAVLLFHISFIVIILGAWITRYVSYEGMMMIREGESSNVVYTSDPYLWVNVNDGKKYQLTDHVKTFLAESYPFNSANLDIEFPGHKNQVTMEYVDFKSKQIDTIKIDSKYKTSALDIVTDGMKSNYVINDEIFSVNGLNIAFSEQLVNGVNVYRKNDTLRLRPNMPLQYIPMKEMQKARQSGIAPPDSVFVKVAPGEEVVFATTTLYQIAGQQFVFKQEIPNVGKILMPSGKRDVGSDYLTVKITDGSKSKIVRLRGGEKMIGEPVFFEFNGLNYRMEYGMRRIKIPFYMKCNDFMLDRYPGSDMPSSYSSDLQVLDTANNEFGTKHVFMNHVLDYGGYRFFQSSYDADEKGTILSVNHDFWGTNVTYLGYLMMFIGMIFSLFAPSSRFRELLSNLKTSNAKKALSVLFALSSVFSFAQESHDHDHSHHTHEHSQEQPITEFKNPVVYFISEDQSDELASLLVQDNRGRIIPIHTLSDQLLRKLYRANKYQDRNAVQTIISMHMYPDYWMNEKVILVPAALFEQYNLTQYVSFRELTDETGNFKWIDDYNVALQKPESQQSETQKKLIKLGEKYQVFAGVINWNFMKIIPLKGDSGNRWFMPFNQELMQKDSLTSRLALSYISSLNDAAKSNNNFKKSANLLNDLKQQQRKLAPVSILPTESHVKMEVLYNKMQIFKNCEYSYLLIGLILMIVFFIRVLFNPSDKSEKRYMTIRKVLVFFLVIIFLYHGAGLGMRWYISGHAPWSDGYEAVVFIAWITMLAGLIFSRANAGILAGSALLAAFMIFVTEMNLLDPEITNLQPVLKSYWLMIHVAIITSSYGFLGLACILGIFNMILYIFRSPSNGGSVTKNINELTYVSEMTMTVGLFMLTIGTFLGGIWANESWGRYWGWDPKETWALVSVLVYSIVLHFRFIPGLKGKFAFNVASMWGYAAILFTFFGVNFILVGLHSYANGDGSVNLPGYVWIMIAGFLVVTIIAGIRNKQYLKAQRELL
ncbi:cytochrome c biogenesis protein [Fluviicola taffensis]|uniref:Cytochrome c assembly protein n=1 Tax=Fluviicola taffensis (strain DSM 16823 / NCIMB 13979 / RW262) TaxID=755732 RepID=F2IHQ4_FLUTR|nr:cytochrome c biogenesis protein CcsA [Fluviicola taffensis]AEA44832.1 cytochrome c assembly protein [Fluviicola taffensis DSM 16823]